MLGNGAGYAAVWETVALMRAGAVDVEVQRKGCDTLKVLARNADSRVAIAEAGGIRTVVEAMG